MLTLLSGIPTDCSILQHNANQNDSILYKSTENWKSWCRLCAKENHERNFTDLLKNEEYLNNNMDEKETDWNLRLLSSIEKYFSIQITCEDNLPKILCDDCCSQITSFIDFSDRVAEVQEMYLALKNTSEIISTNAVLIKPDCLDENDEDVLIRQPLLDINCLEATMTAITSSINIGELDSRYECNETSTILNPIEQHCNSMEIKKERINGYVEFVDDSNDDANVCDVFDYDSNDESSYDNATINNMDKMYSDNLLIPMIDDSNNPNLAQLNEANRKKKEDNLESSNGNGKDNKIVKEYTLRKKRKQLHGFNREKTNAKLTRSQNNDNDKETGNEHAQQYKKNLKLLIKIPQKKFMCTQCSRGFMDKHKLKQHLITHLPKEERQYQICAFCNKKFVNKYILQTHIKHIHMGIKSGFVVRTNVKTFKCEMCEKIYKSKFRLKTHTEREHPEKCICIECGLEFKSIETLKGHKCIHMKRQHEDSSNNTNEGVGTDKLCTENALSLHLSLTHSKIISPQKLTCPHCSRDFKEKHKFTQHLITHLPK